MSQIDLPRRHHLDAITSERWTASDQNRWTPSVRYARTASLESALKGLDAAASKDLLTKLAPENTRHHLMNLSSAVLDRLQGNPKNIELAAISLRDGRLDRLLENATAETDIARHLAEHIIQTLSPDE